ncbi:carbamoyltransferase C-terminal domain-containing protein [Candidatus Pelagibacter communis]|uniref:carbamoyltransferase C-terminal domain-containing protein n=1 Tax=Pelagibacter ubique TaxID=198252 RepID=UPI00092D00A0|nr:carbamoyltransferase C-terminal domain-containing protein [Candidatus Pelagibacter ubique]
MIILGIHDGHDASASLMIKGKIVAANQEERFSRLKGDYGLPLKAIRCCLKQGNISINDVDEIAVASHTLNPVLLYIKRNANFTVSDWVKEQEEYWYKVFYLKKKKINYYKIFKNRFKKLDKYYDFKNLLTLYNDRDLIKKFKEIRLECISKNLNFPKNKIRFYTHEFCHIYYSYYFYPERKNGIAITSEGIGDFSNGSVGTIKNNEYKLNSYTRKNHLGHIYQYITLLLGMKPNQHEYKTMGLAPYASRYEIDKIYPFLDEVLRIKNLNITFKKKPKDLYFYFKKIFHGARFDGIAGAVQKFIELKLQEWFLNCKKELKLNRFYFSGGVAQNIKAAMFLNNSKNLGKVIVPPAAGDSTLSIGACYHSMHLKNLEKKNKDKLKISPIKNMYLGYKNNPKNIEDYIYKHKLDKKFKIIKNYKPERVAKIISKGMIIGRCCGSMEFGLRALGNRSILADPRKFETIAKINHKIKKRDFWMPFTPSVLFEDRNKFYKNQKNLNAKFMSMAFETTEFGRKNLKAAIHPADFTIRPQTVKREDNKSYYDLIKSFKNITKVGALLNTSLNLHGMPIALSHVDALYILFNSDLDAMVFDKIIVMKKKL